MNIKAWIQSHSLKLLAIRDTPIAIASGLAIGIFFGFTPLFGLKTLLAIAFAWLTRSNIIAAIIAVTLHDLTIPVMPVIYRWEYNIGFWLLSDPHHWPPALSHTSLTGHRWWTWTTFLSVGKPLLFGSIVVGLPFSGLCFVVTKFVIERHHRRKHLPPHEDPDSP